MTKEERQDAKHEQEALKSAKEIAKKKSKNKVQKIVWHAVKVAVIPMLILLLKIMAIIIAISLVVSLFTAVIDGEDGTTSTDEEYNSSVSVSGIDITSESWQVSNEEIQNYINNYESDNTALKQEMISKSQDILAWQNTYGYSALFLITVAFEENISADNFDDYLNEMEKRAIEWNEKGYKTTHEIAEDYVGDDTANEWANNIENKMQQNALNTGIITYGEQNISGDGYDNVYVSKDGKIYRNYKQTKGSYCEKEWCGSSIIKDDGCSLIATTIIVSGYRNEEVDPLELAITKGYAEKGKGMLFGDALSGEGISYKLIRPEDDYFSDSEINNTIKAHVGQGKPAIIRVEYPSDFTGGTHYMTLLDYNSETNEIYLSNPSKCNEKTGWLDAEWVLEYCTHFYAIY